MKTSGMSLSELLDIWRDTPAIAQNIAAWRTIPARAAQTASFPADLHPVLIQALRRQGIEALYTHQAAAWAQIQAGQHPVIVTGTASGKTLCYNLPVLHHLLTDVEARALYLFPTKALAHDQAHQLTTIIPPAAPSPIPIAAYDGDTPTSARPGIRAQARLILSNPDMLHTAILPHHTRWSDFLVHLRFVVLDEMHVYRGVFGSHVANVLRRLKRVAKFYGASPQFILTSATIANPTELAERLIEESVTLVDNNGAAAGPKHFLIYNPPLVNLELGARRSAMQEGLRLAQELLQHDVQTIVFARARRTVELLLRYMRENVYDPFTPTSTETDPTSLSEALPAGEFLPAAKSTPAKNQTIRAYRSGYLPRQRREIEQGLRQGQVRAVVATSALELGVDIGGMGAAVLVGYPGTIAGTWQQAGRAGRQTEAALAVLVVSANPLEQFLAHHPAYFFDRPPEQALINPDNLLILLQHVRCAAFELPFQMGEQFGQIAADQLAEILQFLHQEDELHLSGSTYFWLADQYPAEQVSLRSASPHTVRLEMIQGDNVPWATIGEVDQASAPWMVHPEAIYLHEGQTFVVEALDLARHVARLRTAQVDYYTEPQQETSVQLVSQLDRAAVNGGVKYHGEIIVTTQVVGYQMMRWFTQERLGQGQVDLPPNDLHTTGYWFTLAPEVVARLREQGLWSGDPNDYGPNWPAQRNRARARDHYRCRMCGAPEQGREHDVHHQIPFRRFDSYQQANQLTNLITLCRSCHRRAETVVRARSGLSGLATALGHLAPLFLMCDPHDIGIHADPDLPLARKQPGVVIYDMIPAGIGFSQRLFELHVTLVQQTYQLVAACPCSAGCPSCVGSAGEEGVGGKQETLAILAALI